MWFRIAIQLRVTRLIGPLITIVQSMMIEIMKFLVLFIVILVMFGCVGALLFADVTEFSSLLDAMLFLFQCSLGEFNYEPVEKGEVGKLIG